MAPEPEYDPLLEDVARRLGRCLGLEDLGNQEDPLDELVFIVLSARTRDAVFRQTFARLRSSFPDWSQLAQAPVTSIEAALRPSGLEKKKAVWLKALMADIAAATGSTDLSFLRRMPDSAVEEFLTSLPGVGIKTARCVMMYSLDRDVFPLDAHAYRLLKRLGLLPQDMDYRHAHDYAQELVPPHLRHDLHVLAVTHGRRICLPTKPRCRECCLSDVCPSYPTCPDESERRRTIPGR